MNRDISSFNLPIIDEVLLDNWFNTFKTGVDDQYNRIITQKDYSRKYFFEPTKNINDIKGRFYDYETIEADYPKIDKIIPTIPTPTNYGSLAIQVTDTFVADRAKPLSCERINFNRAYNLGPYPMT
jgi:hypothetical protein